MAKAKVIRAYIDKTTKRYHLVGEEVELTDNRFEELVEKEFVKPISRPNVKRNGKMA